MKVKVLEPRIFSGEKKDSIIEMFNIEEYDDIFIIFGGKYMKVKT